jgi:hypothetical protein
VPIKSLKKGRIRGALQDGNREFISLLACVNATGQRLSPGLIYCSESGDIQESWLEDFNTQEISQRAYFATSATGWTSDIHGLSWLERFDQETKPIASNGTQKRLLIIDGHSSHITETFINTAINRNILIVVFPPHCTHRLQPLDISVFGPLAAAYSKGLNEHIFASQGFSSITKRVFWSIFWPAWDKPSTRRIL